MVSKYRYSNCILEFNKICCYFLVVALNIRTETKILKPRYWIFYCLILGWRSWILEAQSARSRSRAHCYPSLEHYWWPFTRAFPSPAFEFNTLHHNHCHLCWLKQVTGPLGVSSLRLLLSLSHSRILLRWDQGLVWLDTYIT